MKPTIKEGEIVVISLELCKPCPKCKGTGVLIFIPKGYDCTCMVCKGTGKVNAQPEVS